MSERGRRFFLEWLRRQQTGGSWMVVAEDDGHIVGQRMTETWAKGQAALLKDRTGREYTAKPMQ